MSIYLVILGIAALLIAGLTWMAARWGRSDEKYQLEKINRKAADRVADAEAKSTRDSTVLLDELRRGGKL